MKKFVCLLFICTLSSCFEVKDKDDRTNVVINKYFQDENTFVIECKGFPKESLKGRARIESAKEAALINAQVITDQLFDDSVDVIRNGTINKYLFGDDFAIIHYIVNYKKLNRFYNEQP